jgi:glycosyltransferase involved in cell wall biosynthesis
VGKEVPPSVVQSRPESPSFVYVYGQRLPNKLANSGAVLNLCKALSDASNRVTLAYLGEPEDEPAIRAAYDLPATMHCTALPSMRRGLYYPAMAVTALRRSGADVVITRMPQVAVIAAMLGKPTILELHQHLELFSHLRLWTKFLFLVRPNRLAIVATTPGIRGSLHPAWRRKATTIATLPSAALDLLVDDTPPSFDVGYVGSFMPGKGVEKVHAMAEALPEVSFVVYGDPTSGPDAAASLEALPNVTLGGFVPNKDIATALASFRIGVAPYASTGFGGSGKLFFRMDSLSSLKVLEYMSAAKAIVSSRIPAIEDCVQDGQSALLCDPDDNSEWTRAVSALANDPALSQRLARNARNTYLQRFTYSVRAEGFMKLAVLMRTSGLNRAK